MERKDLKKYLAPTAEVVCANLDVELMDNFSIEQPEFSREESEELDILNMVGNDVPMF